MQKVVLAIAVVLFSTGLCAMEKEIEHSVGELVVLDDTLMLQALEQKPVNGSMVIIKYGRHYQWAQVRGNSVGNDFPIIQKQEGHVSHGLLLPLEALYTLVQSEKK